MLLGVFAAQGSSIYSDYYQEACAGACTGNSVNPGPATVAPPELSASGTDESATSILYGDAAPDSLHAYVQSTVSNISDPDNVYGPAAAATLAFTVTDDFFFSSSTLPAGTPVSFEITAGLDSTLTTENLESGCGTEYGALGPGSVTLQMYYNNGNDYGADLFSPLTYNTCDSGSDQMSVTGTFQSTIGGDFGIETYLYLVSTVSLLPSQTATAEVIADASDTATITVQVLTPGVTFSSGSGALYDAPEPGTGFLASGGLLCLIAAIRLARRAAKRGPRSIHV